MTNFHAVIPEEKLTEAYRLLLEMRDNCVKHADDQYDDLKREAKYEALNIAITAMGRSVPPRWISVKERLPEEGQVVLFVPTTNQKSVQVGKLSHVGKQGGAMFENMYSRTTMRYYATHWMPRPEPPKESP